MKKALSEDLNARLVPVCAHTYYTICWPISTTKQVVWIYKGAKMGKSDNSGQKSGTYMYRIRGKLRQRKINQVKIQKRKQDLWKQMNQAPLLESYCCVLLLSVWLRCDDLRNLTRRATLRLCVHRNTKMIKLYRRNSAVHYPPMVQLVVIFLRFGLCRNNSSSLLVGSHVVYFSPIPGGTKEQHTHAHTHMWEQWDIKMPGLKSCIKLSDRNQNVIPCNFQAFLCSSLAICSISLSYM